MCIKIASLWLYKYPHAEITKMQRQKKTIFSTVVNFGRQKKKRHQFLKK